MKWHLGTAVAASLAGACGPAPPAPVAQATTAAPPVGPVARAGAKPGSKTPRKPTACGEVVYVNACPADRHPKFECFIHALEECVPATLRITKTTIEGGKVIHDFAVIRAPDGSCSVEGRYDERGDRFGGKAGVTTSRCRGVKPLETASCSTLGMDGC